MTRLDLNDLVREVERLQGVEKADLKCGDLVMVHTRNSSYAIFCLGDGRYRVSGGWFDRTGASPATTRRRRSRARSCRVSSDSPPNSGSRPAISVSRLRRAESS